MSERSGRSVFVIGAGTMGSGIAQVAAAAGDEILLYDQNPEVPPRALARMEASLSRAAGKGYVTESEVAATINHIKPAVSLDAAAGCSVVIEAVKEDLEIKRSVFSAIEPVVDGTALICTNTSMISISAIATVLGDRSRFCGTHFFNPVPRMKLVEIIAGAETTNETMVMARSLVESWGKTAVEAPDSPGFIVNRVFDAIKREALALHEEGVPAGEVDAALRLGLNFPMGPFELMDLIGLDTTYDCLINQARQMQREPAFGARLPGLVAEGKFGRKSGAGFFDYPGSTAS